MKVVIIGASISGLYCAYLLARKGVRVEVYDQMERLGPPARTLIVTSKVNEVLGFEPEEAIINKVMRYEFFSLSKKVELDLLTPELVIERERLIKLLAHQAEVVGARIILNHQFESFHYIGEKIAVSLKNLITMDTFTLIADILVGADGVSSKVARAVYCDGYYSTAALLQAKVVLQEGVGADTCQVWFDSNHTRYFFWSIPESDRLASIGLIADNSKQANESLKVFLEERNLRPLEFQEGKVPLHKASWVNGRNAFGKKVFLVGDSAAQVKVTTVGGVVTGLYGAKALASAILNGRNYKRELRDLNLELDLHLLIRNVLNRFNNENYDNLLGKIDRGLKGIFQRWTRDELRSFFLKMALTKPQLFYLGLGVLTNGAAR